LDSLFPRYGKTNVPNHQPEMVNAFFLAKKNGNLLRVTQVQFQGPGHIGRLFGPCCPRAKSPYGGLNGGTLKPGGKTMGKWWVP